MTMGRVISRVAPVLAAMTMAVSAASAQGRALFDWSGQVDREVDIVMRGNDLSTRVNGNNYGNERSRVQSVLPRQEGVVTVQVQRGRGVAEVVQQPSVRNDFTTIVRIRDDRGGADDYRLTAFWQPSQNGGYNGGYNGGSNGGYDNGRDNRDGRGRDNDRWDRGRDNRDDRGNGGNGGYNNGGYNNGGYNNGGYAAHGALRWTGSVDDIANIRIQGDRVDYVNVQGNGVRNVRGSFTAQPLPRSDVNLRVRPISGRGTIYVVQQPSARNGYTAVIQIHDPQGGFGGYDFAVEW